MKNKLMDLNNHLFEQLERLNDDEITGGKLAEEVDRSKAMCGVADKIISNASLALKAHTLITDGFASHAPEMIEVKVAE